MTDSDTAAVIPEFHVLIAAAGRGTRMNTDMPKQFMPLCGMPVLRRTVTTFLAVPGLRSLSVIIDPNSQEACHEALSGLNVTSFIEGGQTRKDSVFNGLKALSYLKNDDIVLIHDAARPLVRKTDILALLATLRQHEAASLCIPVTETLRRGETAEYVDRTDLYALQTPQGFRYGTLLKAHQKAENQSYTDDTGLVSSLGLPVQLVPGHKSNIKITTQDDMETARAFLNTGETRSGSGFDVHAFDMSTPGPVRLCGLDIPHDHALAGHSDADVGLHALTDAILGALGAGDIGQHFPPTDPANKDIDSAIFLKKAVDLVHESGGRLINLDLTLICEVPKIGPHREAMRACIAKITGADENRISVKATTTEKLGFTGRSEGVAAQALANIMVPYE